MSFVTFNFGSVDNSGDSDNSGGVLDVGALLLVLFIGLKLTGHIDWSWWWVLSPLWIPIVGIVVVVGIAFILVVCIDVLYAFGSWYNNRK